MEIRDVPALALGRYESNDPITVLLIEESFADGREILRVFSEDTDPGFVVNWATQLEDALAQLAIGDFNAILLNLDLPDSQGLETLTAIREKSPESVILILTSRDNEDNARRAVDQGAHDYFIKDPLNTEWLPRAARYLCQRQAIQNALFMEQEWAQVTLDSIGDAVLTTDTEGNVTYLNRVAEAMTGWSRAAADGQPLEDVFTIIEGNTGLPGNNPAVTAMEKNRTVGLSADCVLVRSDGVQSNIEDSAAPIHDRDGHVVGAVLVFHDVSHSRAVAQEMSYLAQHDPLTDLPNRVSLNERLNYSISMARRHEKRTAILFIDLDDFKRINDSLGHATGDKLLKSAAKRFLTCVRETDTICRIGGDEFVMLLSEIDDLDGAAHCAEKLQSAFSKPHHIDGQDLHVGLSIGISVYPEDGNDLNALIQNADTAMYHAKSLGRGHYQFFRADMNARSLERLNLENSLRRALEQNEFILYFQPQMNLESGEIVGAEALLRWQDPDRGLLTPGDFISVAEDSRLIIPIGRWVLAQACRQILSWRKTGATPVPIAINVSALEFHEMGFVDNLRRVLRESGLQPIDLKLELTESVLMQDAHSSVRIMKNLKDLGVQLVVDDFGTGYSSLNYLKRFPIDTLKIDQSFIRDVTVGCDGSTNDDGTIIRAVIGMGRSLNQHVIAEGIETTEQLRFLRKHDCEGGQGFLFGQPVSADDFSWFLHRATA